MGGRKKEKSFVYEKETMGDTRNLNRPADYRMEQATYARVLDETTYVNASSGEAYRVAWAGEGLIQQRLSAKDCASNWVDRESDLRCVGTTNLYAPCAPVPYMAHQVSTTVDLFTPTQPRTPKPLTTTSCRLHIAY